MNFNTKIYIAGHRGMVGSAVWNCLKDAGYSNLIGKTSKELDLRDQQAVTDFFQSEKPEIVIDSAARVGGILANNNFPYQFLIENMQIQNNLIDAALKTNVTKFVFLGSSCIYPKFAPQPLKEEYLLTDSLEPTNEWYALAKITGVKLCDAIRKQYGKDFVSLMPTNLYGERDNFDLETSHVLPAMIRKFHDAKVNNIDHVILWGSGTPMREFLHVKDLAKAVLFTIENKLDDFLYNVGTGVDLSISDLAFMVKEVVGYHGKIVWDSTKPDGTPRKLMDVTKLKKIGWSSEIDLFKGLTMTYQWFLENQENLKKIKLQ